MTGRITFSKRCTNYKDLFQKMEATLRRESFLSKEEFEKQWGKFKGFHYKNESDEQLYWHIVKVIFYSGMNAATVTSRLSAIATHLYDYKIVKDYSEPDIENILNDPNVIRNEKKVRACVTNAKIFDGIVHSHGSFHGYIESFGDLDEESSLDELRDDLVVRFDFLGPTTVYHFMLDMGLRVWKPDRIIGRILKRLSLIDDKQDTEQTVRMGREIEDQVGLPIRYIDIVFVKYGQQGGEENFGLQKGICLERNPRCSICGISEYCNYQP
jgi:DNA-3-methyladenine glycosylase I